MLKKSIDEAETEDIKYLDSQPRTGISVCFLADWFPAVKNGTMLLLHCM